MSREACEYPKVDHKTMKIRVFTPDGGEMWIPGKYIVCDTCRGSGSHVNPAIDGNGITQAEMEDLGEEFFDDYISGTYDVTCTDCNGMRVVMIPDTDRCLDHEYKWWEDTIADIAESIAIQLSEMRAGA